MKIALAQLNYHIGNFDSNSLKIKDAIVKAKQQEVDLIVFSELAICGYPPRDFLEFDDFIAQCKNALHSIAEECKGIAAIVGAPSINPKVEGKNLFNSAYFLNNGKIESIHHKSLLPNYDVFDEYRYFEPNREFEIIEYKNTRIALTICEDLWDVEEDQMYTICPMDELMRYKPDIIVNIAASPFSYNHAEKREQVLSTNALNYHLPLFYVNHVGAQTELVFDGGSMVLDSKGNIVDRLNYFEEDFKIYQLTSSTSSANEKDNKYQPEPLSIPEKTGTQKSGKIERIHNALILGIRDYFRKLGFQKAILGLSGGIDSAVVLVLAAKALGKENLRAILMPSKFSSTHSVQDALQLVENIGCSHDVISIEDSFKSIEETLSPQFKDLPFNIAEENIQARIRGLLLMALSNKFGYILLNTSNKSEMAVGYGTMYGDLCGGISVIGDIYKTEVYELAQYINKDKIIIPENILVKAPSAELRYDQKDSDSLPEYSILDQILFQYIELRKGPKELISLGFEEQLVLRILKLVNSSEYKRAQTPPVLRVSEKAFGMGRRMPIVGKYLG